MQFMTVCLIPLLQLNCTRVLNLNNYILRKTARIKSTSIILTDATLFECNYFTYFESVLKLIALFTPHSYWYTA